MTSHTSRWHGITTLALGMAALGAYLGQGYVKQHTFNTPKLTASTALAPAKGSITHIQPPREQPRVEILNPTPLFVPVTTPLPPAYVSNPALQSIQVPAPVEQQAAYVSPRGASTLLGDVKVSATPRTIHQSASVTPATPHVPATVSETVLASPPRPHTRPAKTTSTLNPRTGNISRYKPAPRSSRHTVRGNAGDATACALSSFCRE